MPDYLSIARRAVEQPKDLHRFATLESVLKGLVIELWSDAAGGLFIVADENDARRLGEPRGNVYTAAEMRRVVQIGDPAIVLEIHEWKRTFNGRLRESGGTVFFKAAASGKATESLSSLAWLINASQRFNTVLRS